MIFVPFDAENISALRNVKIIYMVIKNRSVKKQIIDTSEKTVLIGNIAYTT